MDRDDRHVRSTHGRNALVLDCRPLDRIKREDEVTFEATRSAGELLGWRYEIVCAPPAVLLAIVRWLAGYRHPRHDLPVVAEALRAVFSRPTPLLASTSVRLRSDSGSHQVVLAGRLLAAPDFAVPNATELPALQPFGLLESLPTHVVADAQRWREHLVEVETGLPPDAGPGVTPRSGTRPCADPTFTPETQKLIDDASAVISAIIGGQIVEQTTLLPGNDPTPVPAPAPASAPCGPRPPGGPQSPDDDGNCTSNWQDYGAPQPISTTAGPLDGQHLARPASCRPTRTNDRR